MSIGKRTDIVRQGEMLLLHGGGQCLDVSGRAVSLRSGKNKIKAIAAMFPRKSRNDMLGGWRIGPREIGRKLVAVPVLSGFYGNMPIFPQAQHEPMGTSHQEEEIGYKKDPGDGCT